jgi:hypothetical protein
MHSCPEQWRSKASTYLASRGGGGCQGLQAEMQNTKYSCEEEINERIALGNKAYFVNQKFLRSKLVTKRSKLKIYKTVIRPLVIDASETWVLKEAMIKKLMIFERKVLRRMFGPTKEKDGTQRI